MSKINENALQIKHVCSQNEFDELHNHILEVYSDEEALLERELHNTKLILDCLYSEEDTYWEHCNLKINPDYTILICKLDEPIKNIRTKINIIYPNVMATFQLNVHTKTLGKAGSFVCGIFEIFGYTSFTFNQIITMLEKNYPQMPKEQITKKIKRSFRHLLFDQILLLT